MFRLTPEIWMELYTPDTIHKNQYSSWCYNIVAANIDAIHNTSYYSYQRQFFPMKIR